MTKEELMNAGAIYAPPYEYGGQMMPALYTFNLDELNTLAAKAAADEREALLLLFPHPYTEYFGDYIQDAIRARSTKGSDV